MHVIVLVLWALTLCRTVYSEIISKLYGHEEEDTCMSYCL
jgi:hypothetical protein